MAVLSRACLAAASVSLALLLHGCGSPSSSPPSSSPMHSSSDCPLPAISMNMSAISAEAAKENISNASLPMKMANDTVTMLVGLRGDAAKDVGCCGALKTAAKTAASDVRMSTNLSVLEHDGQAALLACKDKVSSSMGVSVEMTVAAKGKSVGPGTCDIPSAVMTRLQHMGMGEEKTVGGPLMAGRNITLQTAAVKGLSDACCSTATKLSMTMLEKGPMAGLLAMGELMKCWPDAFMFSASANLDGSSGFAAVAKTLQRQTLSFLSTMHMHEENQPNFVM